MTSHADTIVAIATPPGRGGVGIVRLSGPEALSIALRVTRRERMAPRSAHYGRFTEEDGEIIDDGLAIFFPAPASFTGEDVVELQGHGGPVIMDRLMDRCLGLGARQAGPGEFTERAFLNDKIDLAQAEAVADLIDSSSWEAAQAARRSLDGLFSDEIQSLVNTTIELRVFVEAAIDFPDEDVDFLSDGHVLKRLDELSQRLESIHEKACQGRLLSEGIRLVITGRPNAGKSSLLNALARYEAAIVTDIPGTTRDVLREEISIEGMPLHVIDTAGIRETDDPVEMEGVRRARMEVAKADLVLMVFDASMGWTDEDQASLNSLDRELPVTLIENKIDKPAEIPPASVGNPALTSIRMSAKTGEGLQDLHTHIVSGVGRHSGESGSYSARRRHLDALRRAQQCLSAAHEQLTVYAAGELVAEELKGMQDALGEITGAVSADDLLGEIFSSFCIGK